MKFELKTFVVFLMFFALSSCDFFTDKEEEKVEIDSKPKIIWDWSEQRRSDELQLGVKRVDIQPKQSLEILSKSAGQLTLVLNKREISVTKDFLFAQIDREKLENEKKKLTISERAQAVEQTREEEFNRPKKLRELEELIEAAKIHVKRLERIRSSKIRRKNAEKIWGADYANITDEDFLDAKLDLSILEKELAMLNDEDKLLYDDLLELQRMENEEANKSYEEKRENAEYRAAFNGDLRIEIQGFVEGETEYTVGGRDVIATLNDFTEMRALLKIQGEPWVRLEPSSLVLRLKDRTNTEMPFLKEEITKNKQTRREEKSYVFSILTEKKPHLKRLSGTTIEANLIAKLSSKCYLLNKLDVSKIARSRKSKSKFWPDIIDDVWPGAKVVAVGYSEIAVEYQPIKQVEYETVKEEKSTQ